ncbi:TrbG/VirB9 family P-type conjugative transfer protein [Asticcacaulis sp. 201]|uniref:TrbG/VirB9 family P-type conjugative transfer protein n=1 Tax=Asticcacaulis sp. 201 TaxID=3028787 RepID=UPI00291605E7|nr:TrbG/VirB9 family P-type conjugative transfer protein [Asticcacaulis sp. 201]MDV6330273.1 TrbG/VirB9 family P-type conjugative transfer protein [Asticcacaulis sp. 201]
MKIFAFPLILALVPAMASAQQYEADTRLRTLDYDPKAVVKLEGCQNFQTMITLAPDERVENVGVGDSAAWQVMPNKRGNLLFVKAVAERGYTNMTVVSDKRNYNFELRTAAKADCAAGRLTYELRFRYPPAPAAPDAGPKAAADPNAFLPVPEKRNAAYTYSGATELVPVRVFDDGTSTYMKWAAGVTTPAVYALNSDDTESLINYASRGDYFVIEQVARGFVLRRGDMKAVLYNDTYVVQGLDALSPKPRKGGAK